MLCMLPVYVGPKSVKVTCLSNYPLYVGVLQYTTDNILIAKSVDPRVASSKAFLQSVGPQHSVMGIVAPDRHVLPMN